MLAADDLLTNAGALLFVGRGVPAIDYIRRDSAGGDSRQRMRDADRGLIEEVYDVDRAIAAANPTVHMSQGLVQAQRHRLPPRAAREALVNGVAHRDWGTVDPVTVEQTPTRLVVTSPGGFVGGVTSANIITFPSQPRNRALAEVLATLHVAEREGIGVDRMVGDMVRSGYAPPVIEETPGPHVRAALVGSALDEAWIRFLGRLEPADMQDDLDLVLLLRQVVQQWWIDAHVAEPLLQRGRSETDEALDRLETVTVDGKSVVLAVQGVPETADRAWRLSPHALAVLSDEDDAASTARKHPTRTQVASRWARARGRISSTELASIVGAYSTNVQKILRDLEAAGELRPGRENRRGAGFFYVPVPQEEADASTP